MGMRRMMGMTRMMGINLVPKSRKLNTNPHSNRNNKFVGLLFIPPTQELKQVNLNNSLK